MTSAQLRYGAFVLAMAVGVTVGGVAAGTMIGPPPAESLSAGDATPATTLATTPPASALRPTVRSTVTNLLGASATAVRTFTDGTMTSAAATWRTLPQPVRRLWIPALLGVLALTGFAASGVSLLRRPPAVRQTLASVGVTPLAKGRSNRPSSRTPKAVLALADSGAEPSEIAWRTGLSLDAVAMLLSIGSNARQLRPPTA